SDDLSRELLELREARRQTVGIGSRQWDQVVKDLGELTSLGQGGLTKPKVRIGRHLPLTAIYPPPLPASRLAYDP
ncbi:MAG TPA: hypothetical protein VH476_11855, partial [Solirubrobacterales bacterium]